MTESVLAENWPLFPDKSDSWLEAELLSSSESTPSSWRGFIMGGGKEEKNNNNKNTTQSFITLGIEYELTIKIKNLKIK